MCYITKSKPSTASDECNSSGVQEVYASEELHLPSSSHVVWLITHLWTLGNDSYNNRNYIKLPDS